MSINNARRSMRTKKEVIDFLESKVGTTVVCKGNESLNGQCVSLIKALMEYLGVPEPYKARGHAKTCISAYLSEGIAKQGTGFLSVFSNKDMASGYGHIWCNAGDGNGTFYESNGQKPLIVTKGKTYSYDTVCNFDSYIKESIGEEPMPENLFLKYFGTKDIEETKTVWDREMGFLKEARKQVQDLLSDTAQLTFELSEQKKTSDKKIDELKKENEQLIASNIELKQDTKDLISGLNGFHIAISKGTDGLLKITRQYSWASVIEEIMGVLRSKKE